VGVVQAVLVPKIAPKGFEGVRTVEDIAGNAFFEQMREFVPQA